VAALGALSQAWASAEASLPLSWQISSEGPAFEDYLSGSGQYADQALRGLADRLREKRGPVTGG
jgi:hypothetical protein